VRVVTRVYSIADLNRIVKSCFCPVFLVDSRRSNVALDTLYPSGARLQFRVGANFRATPSEQQRQTAYRNNCDQRCHDDETS
jgi:hypothetical protein